tara:strand:+ start:3080 stop:4015 length:936 start_codon:yes stop_codon:yes gene_type:complete
MNSQETALVFPGQGSQYEGMLSSYLNNVREFKDIFEESSDILNINFLEILKNGTKEEMSRTEITQPLMLISDVALWKIISDKIEPTCLAGHSLGEFAALVAAKSIDFKDALYIVNKRAELMQEAVPEGKGGIAAIIGLKEEEINQICMSLSKEPELLVSAANLNSENQIVISGTKAGVDEAIISCKSSGAKRAIPLSMSVPSHSILMLDAAKKFSVFLDSIELKKPSNEVLHNLDALPETRIDSIKDKLVKQIYNPVRWFDIVKSISNKRVKLIIECGPSKVLVGLIKRISPNIETKDLDNYENYLSIINQ